MKKTLKNGLIHKVIHIIHRKKGDFHLKKGAKFESLFCMFCRKKTSIKNLLTILMSKKSEKFNELTEFSRKVDRKFENYFWILIENYTRYGIMFLSVG
jgi:hypothetical protein